MNLNARAIMKRAATFSLMLSLAVCTSRVIADVLPTAQGMPDDVQKKVALRVKVIDGATKKPLRNTVVEIYSDNGIRCIKAPCPTNGIRWSGKTDSRGVVKVPGRVRQHSMTISAAGYGGKDLTRESKKEATGVWVVALDADGRPRSRTRSRDE